MRQFTILQKIGEGVFGEVFMIQLNDPHRTRCALKVIDTTSPKFRSENVRQEIAALKILGEHQGMCKLIDHWEELDKVYIQMELADGEDLITRMEKRSFTALDEDIVKRIISEMVEILLHCKDKGVAHRDIKLDNIVSSANFQEIKLIDFGLSRTEDAKHSRGSAGSVEYSAPEIFLKETYNGFRSDIWSLGVVLYALLYGEFPFSKARITAFQAGQRSALRLQLPKKAVSKEVKDLLEKMLVTSPSKRKSLKKIRKHKWFNASSGSVSPDRRLSGISQA